MELEADTTFQHQKGSNAFAQGTESGNHYSHLELHSDVNRRPNRFNHHASWLIFAVLILTLLLGAGFLFYVKRDLLKAEGKTLALLAGQLTQLLERVSLERYGDLQVLAKTPILRSGNLEAMTRHLEDMQMAKQGSHKFMVTDAHGYIVASTEPSWIGLDYRDHPLFQAVKTQKAVQFQDTLSLDNTKENLAIMFGAPLLESSNEFSGIVSFHVYMQFFEQEILQFISTVKEQYGEDANFEWQLLNKSGDVLLDSVLGEEGDFNLVDMGLPSAIAANTNQRGYIEEHHLRRNIAVITGYAHTSRFIHSHNLGWTVLLRRDKASIMAPIEETVWKLGVAGLVTILPLFILLVRSSSRLQKTLLQTQEVENSISQLNKRNELLLNSAGEGIYGVDTEGKTTFVNPVAAKALGYEPEELIGISMHATVHHTKSDGSPYPQEECPISTTCRDGSAQHIEDEVLWRKDGTNFPVEYTSTPILNKHGKLEGAVITFMDITERRKAEEKFRLLFESAPSGMVMINQQGTIVLTNKLISRQFGYTHEELHGQKIEMLIPDRFRPQHPEHRTIFFANPHPRTLGGSRELYGLHKDGSEFPVELGLNPLTTDEGMFVLASVIDITQRKQAKQALETRNAELARSNQELDDFAYIASHDLKEPLRGINNYATILVEDYGQTMEEEALARCNTMIRLCQRMEELINSLHYFSRVGRTELAMMPTNLQSILEDVLESIDIRLKKCGVSIRVPQPLPTVYCDSARVGEIFRNLITNAMKYNDKEEKWIEIGYVHEHSTEPPFDSIPETIPTFYVRDNGIGIREKHFTTIFGIFRRLHGRNKFGGGTGSGLTITKKLVERHGGTLWVESTFGEGTTFYFTLQGRCRHAINASTANSLG